MANIFAPDIAAAKELIDLFGVDCLWQQPATETSGEPGYPSQTVTPDPIPCKIAFFSPRDMGQGSHAFMQMLAGTEVSVGQEIGLLAGGITFTPDDSDSLIRDPAGENRALAIEKIDRLAPNAIPVLYYVTVAL